MVKLDEHVDKIADAWRELKTTKPNTPHYRDVLKHYNKLMKQYKTAIVYLRGCK